MLVELIPLPLSGYYMGALQSIDESGGTENRRPLGLVETAQQPEQNDMLNRLHDAIVDAHARTSRPADIVMPWEQPSMSWVFSQDDPLEFPSVPPVWDYVEPQPDANEGHVESAAVIASKPTFFGDAIAFNSKRACHLSEGSQLEILAQKWEALVSVNYNAFDLGVQVFGLPYQERVQIVAEVLGGKSPSTLTRRLSQISRFVKWSTSEAKREPFPTTSELIKNYVRHLRNIGSGHTAFKGFAEVMKFMHHVIGLECDLSAFSSAWVCGIIRSAQQSRPLRKQSTTLNVKSLLFLEAFLSDERRALVDRFATGVFLFAVYSRARFGDLRRISKVIIDDVPENPEGSLGFLELHSDSHKMRATGNRLGAHLPLIAPIKGLGPRAWGKDFVHVAELAGLDLRNWVANRPLLPAPTIIGDWTDRSVTTTEVDKWLKGILGQCQDFDPEGFSAHGCKATTLVMLSRYGASPDDRLILGHHQVNKGALEVYARDLQSAPLRILEQMLRDIRCGRFSPDVTRSGLFTPVHPLQQPPDAQFSAAGTTTPMQDTDHVDADGEVEPTPTSPFDDTVGLTPGELMLDGSVPGPHEFPGELDEVVSESESCSDESETEQIIQQLATSERPTGQWHPGCDLYQHTRSKLVHALAKFGQRQAFICGRALSKEYKAFTKPFFVDAMKCQQCSKGQRPTPESEQAAKANAAVKRARKS